MTIVAYPLSLPSLLFFFPLFLFLLNFLYVTLDLCAKSNPAVAEFCAAATSPLLPLSFHSSPFTNVIECTGSDDTDLVDELPDHSCFVEDEIPRVEMRFEHLKLV
nr:uncharacterized protein LOC112796774 [Arachis hypogaea]